MNTLRTIDRRPTTPTPQRDKSASIRHARWVAAVVEHLQHEYLIDVVTLDLPAHMLEANWVDGGDTPLGTRGSSDMTVIGLNGGEKKRVRQAQKKAWQLRQIALGRCCQCGGPSGAYRCVKCREHRKVLAAS